MAGRAGDSRAWGITLEVELLIAAVGRSPSVFENLTTQNKTAMSGSREPNATQGKMICARVF